MVINFLKAKYEGNDRLLFMMFFNLFNLTSCPAFLVQKGLQIDVL